MNADGALARLAQATKLKLWERSTRAFARGAPLLTIDAHDAGSRKPFPERADIDDFWTDLDEGLDEIVVKSRQNMASWAARAADLHLALFRPDASIALVFDDMDDGVDQIDNRIKPMFESCPEWFTSRYGVRPLKGHFIVETCEGRPWRSSITPIPRGSHALRSRVYTRICWEEMAIQTWAEAAYMGAKPTVQGRIDEKGVRHKGQIVAISTPQPDCFFEKLIGSAEIRDHAIEVARGMRVA